MLGLLRLIVALEVLLLPLWAGLEGLTPPAGQRDRRLVRLPAPLVVVTGLLFMGGVLVGGEAVVGVLKAQLVALGFLVLLAGVTASAERVAGSRAAQGGAALVGWGLVAAVFPAGALAGLLDGPAAEGLVRAVVHGNPLVVAEEALGLAWLHQDVTYRMTPLGESYGFLAGQPAAWSTCLAHVFVGTGLLVFSWRRRGVAAGEAPAA